VPAHRPLVPAWCSVGCRGGFGGLIMMNDGISAGQTAETSQTASGRVDDRVRLRIGAATLLVGGLIFLIGVARPVVTDWANSYDNKAERLAIAQAHADEFRFGWITMGIGQIAMGLGVGLLLFAMARLFAGRRAVIADVFAVVAVAGGLIGGLGRAVGVLVDFDRAAGVNGLEGYLGAIGLSLGFVACGLLTWRGPLPRWAGVAFAVAGAIAAITFPAVYMFAALAYGALGLVWFRRGRSVSVG
jgi:hypothetical protein